MKAPQFDYSKWRHGGWYVNNVRYPSGAVGCVSRNYPDGKWRIVCHPDGENGPTYKSRDEAAAAEMELAKKPVIVTLEDGEDISIVGRFLNVRAAEDFLATSATIDPDHLLAGHYGIDAPEELINPPPGK